MKNTKEMEEKEKMNKNKFLNNKRNNTNHACRYNRGFDNFGDNKY